MCTGMEIFTIAATAFQAVSSMSQGSQKQDYYDAQAQERERQAAVEQRNAEFQAQQAEADASAERGAATVRADKVRKQGRQQQSEARAALAAAGVEVGAGTPVAIASTIGRNAEEDALNEIMFGARKADRLDQNAAVTRQYGADAVAAGSASADLSRRAGDNAAREGVTSAFGSVLSSGMKLGDNWLKSGKR